MKIRKNGNYQTRDGQKVRIYATDAEHLGYSIHGAILTPYGWDVKSWLSNGTAFGDDTFSPHDLIPVPKKRKKCKKSRST